MANGNKQMDGVKRISKERLEESRKIVLESINEEYNKIVADGPKRFTKKVDGIEKGAPGKVLKNMKDRIKKVVPDRLSAPSEGHAGTDAVRAPKPAPPPLEKKEKNVEIDPRKRAALEKELLNFDQASGSAAGPGPAVKKETEKAPEAPSVPPAKSGSGAAGGQSRIEKMLHLDARRKEQAEKYKKKILKDKAREEERIKKESEKENKEREKKAEKEAEKEEKEREKAEKERKKRQETERARQEKERAVLRKKEEAEKDRLRRKKEKEEKRRQKELARRERIQKIQRKLASIRRFFPGLLRNTRDHVASVWKNMSYYIYISIVIGLFVYALFVLFIVKIGPRQGFLQAVTRHIYVPALLTSDGVVGYYEYSEARKDLNGDLTDDDVKIEVIKRVIRDNLMDKYNLDKNDKGALNELRSRAVFDSEINIVAIHRMKKIKQMIDEEGDFVRIAGKLGDYLGQVTLTAENRDKYAYGKYVANLEIGEVSSVVYAPEGYYIFKAFDRTDEGLALSYVFIQAKTLEDYLREESLSYRIWSLVD